MELTARALVEACSDEGRDAGITIRATLEPLAGPWAPVKPATYAGRVFQRGRRWVAGPEGHEAVEVISIDNEPSQANRLEAALERLRVDLALPELVLDISSLEPLPPHVPRRLSSFRFPHRNADAYLRDAVVDGQKFFDTEVGQSILTATADRPSALLQWFPQALLFGFWQSHLGKKRSQSKLARSWVSRIAGIRPATSDGRQLGLKGDPLNLSADERVEYNDNDLLEGWDLIEGTRRSGGGKRQDSLAEIGHGQVPVSETEASPAGVSFEGIEQEAAVSFASLRRIVFEDAAASSSARALLVALGLVAHVAAFGSPFSLRSGCDLRARSTTWTWRGGTEDLLIEEPDVAGATRLFHECVRAAEDAGLPVGGRWSTEPFVLTPGEALSKAIRSTYPVSA